MRDTQIVAVGNTEARLQSGRGDFLITEVENAPEFDEPGRIAGEKNFRVCGHARYCHAFVVRSQRPIK